MGVISRLADILAIYLMMHLLYADHRKPRAADIAVAVGAVVLSCLNIHTGEFQHIGHLVITATAVTLLTGISLRTLVRAALLYLTLSAVQVYLLSLAELWGLPQESFIWDIAGCVLLCILLLLMSKAVSLRAGDKLTLISLAAAIFMQGLIIAMINIAVSENRANLNSLDKLIFTISFPTVMAVILLLLHQHSVKRIEQERRAFLEKLIETERSHFLEQEQTMLSLRKFRHDQNNLSAVMAQLIRDKKYAELEEFSAGLNERINELSYSVYSGNNIADAVINEKLELAKGCGIGFDFDGMIPERSAVSDVELASILSNLLDNAIRSAESIPNGYVKTVCRCDKKHLMITVKNSCEENLDAKRLNTSKDFSSEHGFGLEIVSSIVRAHNGELRLSAVDREFTAEVLVEV